MLQTLEQIRNSPAVKAVNSFLRKPGYIILMAALAAVSGVFALDLWVYSAFVLVAVYLCLLGEDLLPLMPIAIFCYITPSRDNNPGRNPQSIFYPEHGGAVLIALAAIFVVCLIFRLATDEEIGRKAFFAEKRRLLGGMLILGAAYLLSGIGLENYGEVAGKNLLFAFIQFASVFAFYYLFTGTVKWENAPKNYLAWIGMCVGFIVLAQLAENYACGRLFETVNGKLTVNRYNMATGWGMHNNIGGMMAFMLPFPFYLACTQKRSWMFNVLGTILLLGVIISCSRTSMLVAMAIYGFCVYQLLRRKECRKANVSVYVVIAGLVVVSCILFFDRLMDIFALFFEELFVVSERDNLISYGFKQFLDNPIFGGSFFPQGKYVPWDWSNSAEFSSFFPPRWHNTLIQMLASCGIVGFAAYCCHRWQTVKLMLKQRSTENLFISLFLISLLVCSLMDCHFFNVGPVLFYSMALAYGENIHESKL